MVHRPNQRDPYNERSPKSPMTTFIVTLPDTLPAPATLCHCAVTSDGSTVTRHSETSLALMALPAGAEVVVMVPAQRLSWHRLELPRGTLDRKLFEDSDALRLRAVLDGLLEDRLLDEPTQMHFALEPHAKAGVPIWVSACDREWLHAWVSALEQAGLPIARIIPELAPPPADEAAAVAFQVTGTTEEALLMASGPLGVTLLPLSDTALHLVLTPEGRESLESVTADPAVAALAEQHFRCKVNLQNHPQRAVLAAQTGWDLAQFDLLRNRRTRILKQLSSMATALRQAPQWRAVRWGAVALLAIHLIGLQTWAWKVQSAHNAKRSAMRSILTTTFPDIRVVVDAPVQMARALADLQRQSGTASSADLETILGQFQAAAPETPAPTAIEFIAGEVLLKGLDPSAPPLIEVVPKLQTQGYAARWDGDNLAIKQERRP